MNTERNDILRRLEGHYGEKLGPESYPQPVDDCVIFLEDRSVFALICCNLFPGCHSRGLLAIAANVK